MRLPTIKIVQKGMLLHMDMNLPPGKNELRMAVRDNRTGNTVRTFKVLRFKSGVWGRTLLSTAVEC